MQEKSRDVTGKYEHMLEKFANDFDLAKQDKEKYSLAKLQEKINANDKGLLKDIDLLNELSFLIRYGNIEIRQTGGQE